MVEGNTQQATKSQKEVEIHLLMGLEIEGTEVYHLSHSDHQGPQMIEINQGVDHMTDKILTIGLVTKDHMSEVGEEAMDIGDMIDHFAREVMTEEVEEDMLPEEIEVDMIEDEEAMIEVTHVAMIEVAEADMIEVVEEVTTEDILVEVTEDIPDHMLQEEIADTQEGMIEDIVAVATIPGVVDIEVEEAMTGVHETTPQQEAVVTIDQEIILDQEAIQVTDRDMMTEDPHQVATQVEATQEVGVTGQGTMTVVDILHEEIILLQIVMIVEGHLPAQRLTLLQADIAADHLLIDLTDTGK